MDEDEYAQRVWERMEQKRRATEGPSAAAREQWGKADGAAARRQVGSLPALSALHPDPGLPRGAHLLVKVYPSRSM